MNEIHSCLTIYNIEDEDYLYKIIERYKCTAQSIITANTDLNPFLLKEKSKIIVPLTSEVISITKDYDYTRLKSDIMILKTIYPFLTIDVIGLSVDGRKIYSIAFGEGENTVIYNGSHHGNEWITSLLLMKWLENICFAYSMKGSINGYNITDIYNNSKIIIVPMVNPDGVELVINGLLNIKKNHNDILKINLYSENFDSWKANLNGVDLNRNYPAGWIDYKKIEYNLGIFGAGPYGYGGTKPFSEPETLSIGNLTNKIPSRLTLSYHTQGEVIYWKSLGKELSEGRNIGEKLSKVSGYKLEDEPIDAFHAGYKDWYIVNFNKPGYTIEAGLGVNPLGLEHLDDIYDRNEELLLLASVI